MNRVIHGVPKETMEYMIRLFSPTMDDYLYVLDLKEDYYMISPQAVERFRLPGDHFYHARGTHRTFVYAEDLKILWDDIDKICAGQAENHNLDYRWLDHQGNPVWINCRGLVLHEADGTPKYLIGCINEIGKKQKADNVSGLMGEGGLWQYAKECPDRLPAGFIIRLGIDDLSVVNGSMGMNYGDYLLKETANCIQRAMEPGQKLFRLVSDQFIITDLTGRSVSDARLLYNRIRYEIACWIEAHQYQTVFTISAGIIDTKDRMNDYDQILKFLEFALNEAKREGKNECYLFQKEDYHAWVHRQKLRKQLLHAVNNGFCGFEIYYQPIMHTREHSLVSAEALMRFFVPADPDADGDETGVARELVMISPAEFIPILEESGLIIPVGRWLVRTAAGVCKEWQKEHPGMRVQVNLSYVQMAKTDVLRDVREVLNETGLSPECLGVELTESGYLEPGTHFQKVWQGLKNLGVKVLLDDFGTGYSNFHCLGDLTPDGIKIDRSFTQRALTDAYEYNLLTQMIWMSRRLNIQVCIEGIETMEELERIAELKPDFIQGYLFCRPVSSAEFTDSFIKRLEGEHGNA